MELWLEILIICVAAILAIIITLVLLLLILRRSFRGPTKGTDNPKRLDGKVSSSIICVYLTIIGDFRRLSLLEAMPVLAFAR